VLDILRTAPRNSWKTAGAKVHAASDVPPREGDDASADPIGSGKIKKLTGQTIE
jgi:hypothetical protein